MNKALLATRIVLPSVMIGMISAISFLEAPLKFQAPGITIPLGLGIGRLVFAALNVSTGILLIVLSIACWAGPAIEKASKGLLWGIWALFASQILLIRPNLNARTDQVIQGTAEAGSLWHYFYIVADVLVLAFLLWFLILQVRRILR